MKAQRIAILLLALLLTNEGRAQGRVSVSTSCSPTAFLCNGILQNEAPINFVIFDSDWKTGEVLVADSIIVRGDSNFIFVFGYPPGVKIYGAAFYYGATYAPSSFGPDTLWVSVYYSHGSSASAAFPFAPQPSPDVGLLGFTTFECWFPGPDSNGSTIVGTEGSQPELVTDTIHDIMNEGTPYNSPFSAQSLGENTRAFLDACAGAIVDSITFESDFSEFTFLDLPSFPDTVPPEDSLVIHYQINPSIVGAHKRPMVFHVHGYDPLVWSFEYSVAAPSSVGVVPETNINLRVFPNPVTNELQILGGQAGTIHLFDIMGRERMTATMAGEGVGPTTLDVSSLEPGIYFLRVGNQSTKVEIAR